MLIGLTIPGSGPVAGPAAAPPLTVPFVREAQAQAQAQAERNLSHRLGLERYQVAYFLALFVCGIGFGFFVGGFVGFMEAATPHGEQPYSFAQLAASDVGWAATMRQYRSASHHSLEPAAHGEQKSCWWRIARGASILDSAGDSTRVLRLIDLVRGPETDDGRPAAAMRKAVVAR